MESIIPGTEKGVCYICERRGHTEWLCRECHSALHDKGKYDRELEEIAQKEFEKSHSRAEFMRVFWKNYL